MRHHIATLCVGKDRHFKTADNQNMPPGDMPLCHKYSLELKTIEIHTSDP